MIPIIQNVVSTAYLGVYQLNLTEIVKLTKDTEYNPKKFVAAIMRIKFVYIY
jgi:TATA-box binding protein (TBP) (component of TFIID and TFIIIB)